MTIRQRARPFARPHNGWAVFHLVISLLIYAFAIALGTIFWGNWLVVALACVLFAGGAVRLFGVQHDNGHLTYFSSRRANVICGVILGAVTFNPYFAMRYNHNQHHAHLGNLDRRDAHEVLTWTVREFQEASNGGRLFYRIYRSAPVIYFVGPIWTIFFQYRMPRNWRRTGVMDLVMQNGLMFGVWAFLYLAFGWDCFAFYILANVTTACTGTIMVYVGHNYEHCYWAGKESLNFDEAALKGASVLDFGPVFNFMTFNFAFHDLHHLYARIPCYRLGQCHRALRDVLPSVRIGLWEAVACVQWKLWDEAAGKMIRFADLPPRGAVQPAE